LFLRIAPLPPRNRGLSIDKFVCIKPTILRGCTAPSANWGSVLALTVENDQLFIFIDGVSADNAMLRQNSLFLLRRSGGAGCWQLPGNNHWHMNRNKASIVGKNQKCLRLSQLK